VSFLDRIAECSVFDPAGYVPVRVDGTEIGLVSHDFAGILGEFPQVFAPVDEGFELDAGLTDVRARTDAVHGVLLTLRERGLFPHWRDEPFPVVDTFSRPPFFQMERAAVARFGVRGHGVHLNGYVRDGGETFLWVARRAMDRHMDPGKLDQLVAGGQPAGLSLRDNLVKECGEEAAIPRDLALKAKGAGAISYWTERLEGLRRDTEFVYDLELPSGFVPRNTDGEVAAFELWPVGKVAETVRDTTDFKFNCALVNIDFLIRHGFIEPDYPDYVEILHGLRRR